MSWLKRMYLAVFAAQGLFLALAAHAQSQPPAADGRCGEVLTYPVRGNSTLRVAFVPPSAAPGAGGPVTLVLLAGGSGHVNLDERGCARGLVGNSLVRSIPVFRAQGLGTALVDAPSDFQDEDGLGGFRTDARHAEELGLLIADLRARTRGTVWIAGTSRGSISAVNAASRLSGASAPDGVVLTSALMVGQRGARKAWVSQTVFDLRLEDIRMPLLLIGHEADKCLRSPPGEMGRILARTRSVRQQLVTVVGGPAHDGPVSLEACEGRTPHGYRDQEAEVAAGMQRFIRGERY